MVGDADMIDIIHNLDQLQTYLRDRPKVARKAARLALNQTADRRVLAEARKRIMEQIAFPRNYLTGRNLRVSRRATETDLTVVVSARQRPTSLARFALNKNIRASRRGAGVRLRVKSGATTQIRRAFLVRLRQGGALSDDVFNLGLAIRLKPGEQIINRKKAGVARFSRNVVLLYGPSVDQVFQTVREDIIPDVTEYFETEFTRQFARLDGG